MTLIAQPFIKEGRRIRGLLSLNSSLLFLLAASSLFFGCQRPVQVSEKYGRALNDIRRAAGVPLIPDGWVFQPPKNADQPYMWENPARANVSRHAAKRLFLIDSVGYAEEDDFEIFDEISGKRIEVITLRYTWDQNGRIAIQHAYASHEKLGLRSEIDWDNAVEHIRKAGLNLID